MASARVAPAARHAALVALADWDALTAFLPQARTFTQALALFQPASDRAEGLACAAAGERVQAEELLRRALAGFAEMGVVFETAFTKEELAGVVVESSDACQLRAEALAAYEQLGAHPHSKRVQAELSSVAS